MAKKGKSNRCKNFNRQYKKMNLQKLLTYKICLNKPMKNISTILFVILVFIGINLLKNGFSETIKQLIILDGQEYSLVSTIGGIGGHIKITFQKKVLFKTPINPQCKAVYSTFDLSPVYFSVTNNKIHFFSDEEFKITGKKCTLPVVFHAVADTTGFKNVKIVHPYFSG